jgi:thiamine biosynthesis lipoprotein
LRAATPGEVVAVSTDTVAVLRSAVEFHEATDGLFDVAVGRALVAAGFLPRADNRHLARMTGITADINIVDDTHVRCRKPMLIDLGGIAKGYAVDRAVEVLRARGARQGVVNAGGDIRVFGPRHEAIDIRGGGGNIVNRIGLRDSAIATSCNADARRSHGGRTVTPHLGRRRTPILADEAISVVASTCMIADALTKVALADRTLAEQLLARHDGCLVEASPGTASA